MADLCSKAEAMDEPEDPTTMGEHIGGKWTSLIRDILETCRATVETLVTIQDKRERKSLTGIFRRSETRWGGPAFLFL